MNREDSENGVVMLFSTVNTSNMRNRPFSKSFLFQSEPEWKDFLTKSESILIHIECPTNYRHKIFPTWTRLQIETEGNSEMTYSWVNSASSARETNILHHLPLILFVAGVFSILSAREECLLLGCYCYQQRASIISNADRGFSLTCWMSMFFNQNKRKRFHTKNRVQFPKD